MDIGLQNTAKTIITCCVLHNICHLRGDFYIDDDNVLDQVLPNERLMRRAQANSNVNCPSANCPQDILADYVDRMIKQVF